MLRLLDGNQRPRQPMRWKGWAVV